ncbi:Tetratricopeptide repeat protein 36 [Phlyctochytrium planicorne]|nr:Tetratricopeptide repeat protein 36 [Phlyctochytrium planicorne]
MSSPSTSTPSKRDQQILDLIFNPDLELVLPEPDAESSPYPSPDEDTLAKLKGLEKEAVGYAEKGKIDDAIAVFGKCVVLWSTYASSYNNRAQAYRMKGENEKALADLDLAIQYGVGDAKILKQAYSQRGFLRKHLGNVKGAEEDLSMGAKYGNDLAKAHVQNNPYAKMCGAMVQEAMARLKE